MNPSRHGEVRVPSRSTFLCWLRPALGLSLGVGVLVGLPGLLMAQHQNPLFNRTSDRNIISQQVHLALPSAERGLALLTNGGDPAHALQAIGDTYRYLRAAQESTEDMMHDAKFPDPLWEIETKRMWEIRTHMLKCTNETGHILRQDETITRMCADNLVEGIRKLRILLAVMP